MHSAGPPAPLYPPSPQHTHRDAPHPQSPRAPRTLLRRELDLRRGALPQEASGQLDKAERARRRVRVAPVCQPAAAGVGVGPARGWGAAVEVLGPSKRRLLVLAGAHHPGGGRCVTTGAAPHQAPRCSRGRLGHTRGGTRTPRPRPRVVSCLRPPPSTETMPPSQQEEVAQGVVHGVQLRQRARDLPVVLVQDALAAAQLRQQLLQRVLQRAARGARLGTGT